MLKSISLLFFFIERTTPKTKGRSDLEKEMDADKGRVAYTNDQKEIYHMQAYILEFLYEFIVSNTGYNILS
jgi:hypothetical protein